ncbi:hypothetical protein DIJ64_12705 [Mycobacterium leprae]|uniref:Uncharacterized protein n=1 Tax=Mycobacterium leprae TaxID=1769 RepID=A0AAD0P7G7_MYCLR|nr:hypothetical protein DIJ64_12705 [Mycobacterium leprae]OAR21133.1 hypothetical protein A8144_01355 [Mycobacterium leprae 3125609]OAX72130.1 hypothetical protein A3216_01430 [Mycobacterium leprae 7935681]
MAQQLELGEANITARLGFGSPGSTFGMRTGDRAGTLGRARQHQPDGAGRCVLGDGWSRRVDKPSAIPILAPDEDADPQAVRA